MPSHNARGSSLEHYMVPPKGVFPNLIEGFKTKDDLQLVTDEVRHHMKKQWEERKRNDPYWVFIQGITKRLEKRQLENRRDKDTHFKTVADASEFYHELAEDAGKVVTRGYYDRGSSWGAFSDEAEQLRIVDDLIEAQALSKSEK